MFWNENQLEQANGLNLCQQVSLDPCSHVSLLYLIKVVNDCANILET